MVSRGAMQGLRLGWAAVLLWACTVVASAQQAGGIRGLVMDQDFDAQLPGAQVQIAESGVTVTTTDEGNYTINNVEPGIYTLVISKEGFTRQVKGGVVVAAGQLTEVDASLSGEFAEMEEFVVQDIQFGGTTDAALLELRFESPALMDSISADLMSQAGAGDAASALTLVPGATVQDGKFAVVRGLPDRYVNSQINGIRLPTADEDKRAVQLDQFPAAAIESIQVSKTFTPDQQGDASGGAVNVVLKGIPDQWVFKLSGSTSYNTQSGGHDFLTYGGGGVDYWGTDDGGRLEQTDRIGKNWTGDAGVKTGSEPTDYKWSVSAGGKIEYDEGFKLGELEFDDTIKFGGLASFFYERDSSHTDDGFSDRYWVDSPGENMTPQYSQGAPSQGDFRTSLFDVAKSSEEVKWGSLGVLGVETEDHKLTATGLITKVTEDTATLLEDTRGKAYYFPGYDVNDPQDPGNQNRDAAPYIRTETLKYVERETLTLQLAGWHRLPVPEYELGKYFKIMRPEFDWSVSRSTASLYEPDKRQFGSIWLAEKFRPGFPIFNIPPTIEPEEYRQYKPDANFTLGNLQRTWKDIYEESNQFQMNLKFPYQQWTGDEGFFKVGMFKDRTTREFNQDSYSNFNDNTANYFASWDESWSEVFPDENHPIRPAEVDVDYKGEQNIMAWYYMADVPLASFLSVTGGVRYENSELSIINVPERDVLWFPPGSTGLQDLLPGEADVKNDQQDVLPAIGFKFTPLEQITLRGSYAETIARQTFKELTPIQQQEFLGGDVFIGNPFLRTSSLKNYDLRLDYTPFEGSLMSVSYFYKDIKDPIENVQRVFPFTYTTPVNYPEGELSGFEFEVRQQMGHLWKRLEGLSLGGNATVIDSEVVLPDDEVEQFALPTIKAPIKTREMTNAPDYLYNLFMDYKLDELGLKGTKVGVFYTVRGDTLVAGAGTAKGNFVPSVYEKEFGTLNANLSQKIGEHLSVRFQAKNLLDPRIETVYRSDYVDGDKTKTRYRKGREYSVSLSVEF